MPQNVLVNGVWAQWLSDVMIELNAKFGSGDGRILLSNTQDTGGLKFTATNLSMDLSAVASDVELAAQKTANASGAGNPIVDVRDQTVYTYAAGAWTAQPTGSIKNYISVGQYYRNATNQSLFFAFSADRLDKIADFGPANATQAQVNAGTATNVAVSAAQAKIAWQLWKTQ